MFATRETRQASKTRLYTQPKSFRRVYCRHSWTARVFAQSSPKVLFTYFLQALFRFILSRSQNCKMSSLNRCSGLNRLLLCYLPINNLLTIRPVFSIWCHRLLFKVFLSTFFCLFSKLWFISEIISHTFFLTRSFIVLFYNSINCISMLRFNNKSGFFSRYSNMLCQFLHGITMIVTPGSVWIHF